MQCSLVPVFSIRANSTIVHHVADLDSRPFYQFDAAEERRRAPQDGEKPRPPFCSAVISRRHRRAQAKPTAAPTAELKPTGVPTAVPTTELKPTGVPTSERKPTAAPTQEL